MSYAPHSVYVLRNGTFFWLTSDGQLTINRPPGMPVSRCNELADKLGLRWRDIDNLKRDGDAAIIED